MKFAIGAVLVLAVMVAPAASRAAEVRPVLVAGYDTGGDDVEAVTFNSGQNDSIKANEGLYLGGGVSVLNDAGNLEFLGRCRRSTSGFTRATATSPGPGFPSTRSSSIAARAFAWAGA